MNSETNDLYPRCPKPHALYDAIVAGGGPAGIGGNLNVHPEYLKKVLFDLFDRHGIDYQLYSPVADVVKEATR